MPWFRFRAFGNRQVKVRTATSVLGLWVWMLACSLPAAEPNSPQRVPTPDLTGVWRIAESLTPVEPGAPAAISVEGVMMKFRRDVLTRAVGNLRRFPQGDRRYCAPAAFTGPLGYAVAPGIFPVNFEILSSPGRLTLIDELGVVRRLHLRAAPPADALDESNAGTSVARWNGGELVVQTTGLNPAAQVVLGVAGTELGRNARIDERFSMPQPDVLQIVTTVTAPELYAAPVTTTNRYRREVAGMMYEISTCSTNDRAYDQASGKERFDSTPPADLPRPPR